MKDVITFIETLYQNEWVKSITSISLMLLVFYYFVKQEYKD